MKPEVWLTMIVRNEAPIIGRCLRSVRRHVTGYVIVDTGSTDDTRSAALQVLGCLPGRYAFSSWSGDFSTHRNEAADIARNLARQAKAAWFLTIDADETLVGDPCDILATLDSRYLALSCYAEDDGYYFLKTLAVRLGLPSPWRGELHEYVALEPDAPVLIADPGSLKIRYRHDGARRRSPAWARHDLDSIVRKAQNDFRDAFFRARTLEVTGELGEARRAFREASERAGATEEWFQSAWGELRVLMTNRKSLQRDAAELAMRLVEKTEGQRAEPLLALAEIALDQHQYEEAMQLAQAAGSCPAPVGTTMYDGAACTWKPLLVAARAADGAGKAGARVEFAGRALDCRGIPRKYRRELRELQLS